MIHGVDTLATMFSNLSSVIEAFTKDFLNMLRNLSVCGLDFNKRPKIETYACILDNCLIKNR